MQVSRETALKYKQNVGFFRCLWAKSPEKNESNAYHILYGNLMEIIHWRILKIEYHIFFVKNHNSVGNEKKMEIERCERCVRCEGCELTASSWQVRDPFFPAYWMCYRSRDWLGLPPKLARRRAFIPELTQALPRVGFGCWGGKGSTLLKCWGELSPGKTIVKK